MKDDERYVPADTSPADAAACGSSKNTCREKESLTEQRKKSTQYHIANSTFVPGCNRNDITETP